MKKIVLLFCLIVVVVLTAVGCSQEDVESLVDIYDAVSDLGESAFDTIDSTVREFGENGTAGDISVDIGKVSDSTLEDLVNDFTGNGGAFRMYEVNTTVTGYDVMTLLSSAKSANLSVLIQLKDEPTAVVCGRLITADNTPYVEGLNELSKSEEGKYTYNFCEYNGIIRKVISSMPERKFVVYQYDAFNNDITAYTDLDSNTIFDILTLIDSKGNTVGFYCSER